MKNSAREWGQACAIAFNRPSEVHQLQSSNEEKMVRDGEGSEEGSSRYFYVLLLRRTYARVR